MQNLTRLAVASLLSLAAIQTISPARSWADTLYWNGVGTGWDAAANWSASSSDTLPNPAVVPSSADTVIFNISPVQAAQIVSLNANQSVYGIQFGGAHYTANIAAVGLQSGTGGPYTLTIGAGGITNGAFSAGNTINANVVLGADQTWSCTNGGLYVSGNISGAGNLSIGGNVPVVISGTANNIQGTITVNTGASLTMQQATGVNAIGNLIINGVVNASQVGLNASDTAHSITFNANSTLGAQSNIDFAKPIILNGNTNFYTNGHAITFSGNITQSAGLLEFRSANGVVTITGNNNSNLNVSPHDTVTLILDKASSSSVHAVGSSGIIGHENSVIRLAGTGGDQIADTANVGLYENGSTLDLNGRTETINAVTSYWPNSGGIISNNATGSTGTLTIGTNNSNEVFGGSIRDGAGAVAITKVGTGKHTIAGVLSYSGPTTVKGGTLSLSGTGNTSSGTLYVGAGATLEANTSNSTGAVLENSISPNSALTLAGGTLNVKGHTSGDAVMLSYEPQYVANSPWVHNVDTSHVTIGQEVTGWGIQPGTVVQSIWDGGATIFLSKYTTQDYDWETPLMTSALTVSNSQSVKGLTLAAGASTIYVSNFTPQVWGDPAPNTTGNTVLNLNAITRQNGATIDFNLTAGTQTATNGITTTTVNSSNGTLGGWATVANKDWAVSNATATTAGNITPLASYDTNTFASGKNTDVTNSFTVSGNTSTNSLRFDASGTNTLTITDTATIASGGILVSNAHTDTTATITGGSLTSGNGEALIVHQNNTTNALTIKSAIVNNGATAIGLIKSGVGNLILNESNTYTGATHINAGTLTVTNMSNLGNNSAVILSNNATLSFTNLGGKLDVAAMVNADHSLVQASTVENGGTLAYYAFDGNNGSRWSSAAADPQWIYIDMGDTYNISSVAINWETARAKDFKIQLADSNATNPNEAGWTTYGNFMGQNPSPGVLTTYNLSAGASGRYLAMYGLTRQTPWGYSIYEMQIFRGTGPLTQTIGSLASSDATTKVNLGSYITLNTGSDNSSTTFAGTIVGGALNKTGSGVFTLTNAGNSITAGTTISAGTLVLAGPSASTGGAIDNNAMLVLDNGSTLASVVAQVVTARHNGAWDVTTGSLFSSQAKADYLAHTNTEYSGLAVVRNGDLYQPVAGYSADAIIVKHTIVGDADLDGILTMDDYLAIDSGYLFGGSGWVNGDFDYNGVVNAADYAIIDHAYLIQHGPSAQEMISLHASWFGDAYSTALETLQPIPEPASLGLLALASLTLLRRRR